jgi:hypothetical protein
MAYICCYRSGEVFVSKRVPKGAIELVRGHGTRLKRVLSAQARPSYDGVTLLVPGIPEADTDLQALEAAKAFELLIYKALATSPWRKSRGGG